MNHVDPGHHLEQRTGDMLCRAAASTRHAQPAGIGLSMGDEVGNSHCLEPWCDLESECLAADARDRRDIADEIVVELVVERRIDGTLNRDQQERMPISGSLDDRLNGKIAATPRAGFRR
jgi:hypothetical protein